ncbi:acylneuraminate cytidylyltransferase [Aquimarina sp. AD1]|uniref:acylneuraminate cytidylyltransferase n=1 Tax=Aquimarina sp. (strain AD1) TaxID=1714848 RepID=UPI000E51FEA9|nr:acylneuraminate cytidylyltransferase [Aquimarina sp. AD1]AXT57342.1 acylneuraminate cytidylyltransferase [Aquimarina sp. AD1]RKN02893.1 acylneuraminate cytidylyltransferase [Aquimarina sp. AD1]
MKTIAFIPVRGGSKSIPLKNIKEFCGKPLVYWTIKAAVETKSIDEVIIATDHEQIETEVNSFGFNKVSVYRRNSSNAQDSSSTESVILEYLEVRELDKKDAFVLIQATSPLLSAKDLTAGIKMFDKQEYDSVLSCVLSKRFFWKGNGDPINYDPYSRPRRQDFEGIYMENGAFYINTVGKIKESSNRLSGNIGICLMPEYTDVELDEEDDWQRAEILMKKYILSEQTKKKITLFISDIDGVLTDAGMYYSENGDELKKFNTHDGMAFQLIRESGVKTAIITSENTELVKRRADKLKVDYLYQGKRDGGKLSAALEICEKEGVTIEDVAYIGDDINCFELLSAVGLAACPSNALRKIRNIPGIIKLSRKGGEGVVREFYEEVLAKIL